MKYTTPDLFDVPEPMATTKKEIPTKVESRKPVAKIEQLHFKHRELPDWAKDILEAVTVEPDSTGHYLVKLHCGQIERDQYTLVNEVLDNIGGKWKGNKKAHVFTYDPSEVLLAIQKSGKVPEKNPLDFFPTPEALLEEIIQFSRENWIFTHFEGHIKDSPLPKVLEPSAGTGAIIRFLTKKYPLMCGHIDAIEANPFNVCQLQELKKNGVVGKVIEGNFLEWTPVYEKPEDGYRIILMNPPFSYKGNCTAYVDHILHAWEILKSNPEQKDAVLIAITPQGWLVNQGNKKLDDFRDIVFLNGAFERLPNESFKESGTAVPTAAIHLCYNPSSDNRKNYRYFAETFCMLVDNEKQAFDRKKEFQEEWKNSTKSEQITATTQYFRYQREEFLKYSDEGFPYAPEIVEMIWHDFFNCE